ncbi:MAG: hypothetical protein WA672_01040 [Candidatus Angelobacter sp.]
MFQTVIAVFIGMTFMYFILAVLCSGVKEFIAAKLDLRAKTLESAIARMLSNQPQQPANGVPPAPNANFGAQLYTDLATQFYDHALIQGLGTDEKKPSYIPAQYFSTVLEEILKAKQVGSPDYAALIRSLPEGTLKSKLKALADRAGNDAQAIRGEVEKWFDTTMDRVSGWYKRKAQKILLAIAFALVVAVNADSFAVFRALWQNSALRDTVVAAASKTNSQTTPEQAKDQLSVLPLGWKSVPSWFGVKQAFTGDIGWWLLKLAGLVLTAFAVTLGAPFWFDAMNNLINLRMTGTPPQKATVSGPAANTLVIETGQQRTQAAKA